MPPRKSAGPPRKTRSSAASEINDTPRQSAQTDASPLEVSQHADSAVESQPQPALSPTATADKGTNHASSKDSASSPPSHPIKKVKFQPRAAPRRTQLEREELEREEAARQAPSKRSSFTALGRDGRPRPSEQARSDESHRSRPAPPSRQWQASGVLGGDEIRGKATRGGRKKADEKQNNDVSQTADSDVVMTSVEGEQATSAPQKKPRVKSEAHPASHVSKEGDDDQITNTVTSRRKINKPRTKVKKEDDQIESLIENTPWEDETGKRVDISHISLISSSEEESNDEHAASASKVTSKHATSRLLPVRLERHDHVDQGLELNTDSSSFAAAELKRLNIAKKSSQGLINIDEDRARQTVSSVQKREKAARGETARERRIWRGAWQDDENDEAFQLNEVSPPRKGGNEKEGSSTARDGHSDDSDDLMQIDEQTGGPQTMASPADQRKGGSRKSQSSGRENAVKGRPRKVTPRYLGSLPPDMKIPDPKTNEDLSEMIRMAEDLRQVEMDPVEETTGVDTSNSIYGFPSELQGNRGRENRVYLLQLPPIMPKLRDRNHPPPKIKEEKGKTTLKEARPRSSKSQSRSDRDIKADPDKQDLANELARQATSQHVDDVTTISNPTGCSGTLTFYKAGAKKANWGGLELDVVESHRAGFGQEILVHEYQAVNTKIEGQDRWEEVVDVGTDAYSMGQVAGGFVAGPDWEVLLDD